MKLPSNFNLYGPLKNYVTCDNAIRDQKVNSARDFMGNIEVTKEKVARGHEGRWKVH